MFNKLFKIDTNSGAVHKSAVVLMIAVLVMCVLCFVGCVGGKQYCKVTFIQGENVSVRTVEKGTAVTNVPFLTSKRGYTVTWGNADLTNVLADMTVYAVETPNTYYIKYDLNGVAADVPSDMQKVTFGVAFSLYKPTASGYTFIGWVIDGTDEPFVDGAYDVDGDIRLVAVWQSDRDWSEFH